MTVLMRENPLAAKKPKDAPAAPLSAKLPADVVESARIVAAFRNQSMADLIGEILRPVLKRMEAEEIAKRTKSNAGGKP